MSCVAKVGSKNRPPFCLPYSWLFQICIISGSIFSTTPFLSGNVASPVPMRRSAGEIEAVQVGLLSVSTQTRHETLSFCFNLFFVFQLMVLPFWDVPVWRGAMNYLKHVCCPSSDSCTRREKQHTLTFGEKSFLLLYALILS